MIVMDMDDTLLNEHHELSSENKQALLEAHRAGIIIVLASGRPTPAMAKFADDLKMNEGGFVISYNGAFVTDWNNQEVLYETCLTKFECDLLVNTAHTQNVNIHTYVDGDIITDELNEYTDVEAELTSMPIQLVSDLKTTIKENVPKVLMVSEPTKLKQVSDKLKRTLGGRFMISISKPFFLEFTNKEVDKSNGISVLCERLNISKQDVMAIGDSYNDLTMIRDCGVGVAMENAPQDIKDIADVQTLSNKNNGVAYIVKKVIESQQLAAEA
jgi:Cof subfamily protein (haloacid dehalogenase superfamily)